MWLSQPKYPSRCVVKITDRLSGNSVYCEGLQIDNNFIGRYNGGRRHKIEDEDVSTALVVNEWYRRRLGDMETQQERDLEITISDCYRGRLLACMQHPQNIVRVATWLGIVSVALGIFGFLFGIVGFRK